MPPLLRIFRKYFLFIAAISLGTSSLCFSSSPLDEMPPAELCRRLVREGSTLITMALPEGNAIPLLSFPLVSSPTVKDPGLIYGKTLMEALFHEINDQTKRILILGAGNGYEAMAIARRFKNIEIDAIDISNFAVELTKMNADLHEVKDRVHAWQSDLFSTVSGQYDLIAFTAPRPMTFQLYKRRYPQLTKALFAKMRKAGQKPELFDWDAKLLRRLLKELPDHLNEGGALILMSDSGIGRHMPRNLVRQTVSEEQRWDRRPGGAPNTFVIHKITRRGRP